MTRARRGISLLETIVAVSVLGLLVALLLPALSSMRETARGTRCLANMRQMAVAAQTYAATYDAWPVAIRYEIVGGVPHQIAWDWETTVGGELVGPGPLWSFTDTPGDVQQCPSHHGPATGGDPYTGYNYNTTYIGGEAPYGETGWDAVRRGVAPHACRRACDACLFGDGGRAGGTNKFMRAPLATVEGSVSLVYAGGQAFRHAGASNVAYADGHVGPVTRAWEGQLASESLLQYTLGFPHNGFLSDDDSAYDPR